MGWVGAGGREGVGGGTIRFVPQNTNNQIRATENRIRAPGFLFLFALASVFFCGYSIVSSMLLSWLSFVELGGTGGEAWIPRSTHQAYRARSASDC